MDWNDPSSLNKLDQAGYTVLEAVASAGLTAAQTYSRPNAFVSVSGETFWVKSNVQQGLVAELIAGRLAAIVGAGPQTRIVRVTPEILPPGGVSDHLVGVVVGSLDQPGMVNARDLAPLMANGQFKPGVIDAASLARVVAFHTWLGMGDAQVLVNLLNGRVMTIDHGECFGSVDDFSTPPTVTLVDIPGVDPSIAREEDLVRAAIDRVEAVTDDDILRAVAQVPSGSEWRSPTDRRLAIARFLAHRRTTLRKVLEQWMNS